MTVNNVMKAALSDGADIPSKTSTINAVHSASIDANTDLLAYLDRDIDFEV